MKATEVRRAILDDVANAFIGPEAITETLLISLIAGGHVLLEGVPGVAKTTLAKRFSDCLGCTFNRIQFTQDLLPTDVTGTHIFNMQSRQFEVQRGPVFAHIVLGDEINRAPPKAQSALLEAMQENQVTLDGTTFQLPTPFMVIATRNPIEQAGVYPLPEAQLDRFLICLEIGYPSEADEVHMLSTWRQTVTPPAVFLSPKQITELQTEAAAVHAAPAILQYIVKLVSATRDDPRVALGASPRAALGLLQASRAHALLCGRSFIIPDDVKHLACDVLSHRLLLTNESVFNGLGNRQIVEDIATQVECVGPVDEM
ncbi:MAG: AAA family ATPase [Bradymonadia bacterium]